MPNKEGGYGGYRREPGQTQRRVVRTARDPVRDAERAEWVQPAPQRPSRPQPTPQQQRAAARRVRERRRRQRRNLLLTTAAGILVLSGVITLLLPESSKTDPINSVPLDKPAVSTQVVAPLPYGGGDGTAAQAVDWGAVGPERQTAETGYTYTDAPAQSCVVPEFGKVTSEWFDDAAFLGDSLTVGLDYYNVDVGDALICGYEGTSPNQIVNRTTLNHDERGDEIPLDVLAAAQPKKLYVLLGTNALVSTSASDDGFLAYYGRMLDELRAALPDTTIFVQSILPVRPEALENAPGLNTEHLDSINASLQSLCAERGCWFLDLNGLFRDADGSLNADYAESDGIHLNVSGYRQWVSFLCSHVPYDRHNPYQAGSTYYLDDSVKELLNDLP